MWCGAAMRRRQMRRTVDVTAAQLDALVERGYLNPVQRGDRADEFEAIEAFLLDSLIKR